MHFMLYWPHPFMVILLHICPYYGLMGYGQGSHLLLLLACSQSMALTWYWKNQRCGGAKWNPPRPSWCDVHVHHIMEEQLMTSKNVGGLLWEKAFINISLVMHGQIISGLITINLVNDNIYHGLVFKFYL
jgi:hypothetical protein